MTVRQVPKQAFYLVSGAAFAGGALTIALEIILMRLTARYTGAASDGTITTLTVYLLGLLAGAALVLKLNNRSITILGRSLLISLGLLVAACALLSTSSLLPDRDILLLSAWGGLPFSSLLIFPPAFVAGTIFPLLLLFCGHFYFGSKEQFIADGGTNKNNNKVILLYLISNLGSALGAISCAVWLLPRLGIARSLIFTALSWIFVALLMIPLTVRLKEKEEQEEPSSDIGVVSSTQPSTYMCVFFGAFVGLIFECLALRMLTLICGASFLTTACAVCSTLLAIALGARLALLLPAPKNTRLTMALALSLSAAGLATVIILLPHLNNIFQAARLLTSLGSSDADQNHRWLAYFYPRLIVSIIFCLPAATAFSLFFPLAARGASRPKDMLRLYLTGGLGTALAPLVFNGCLGLSLPNMPSSMDIILKGMLILLTALTVATLADKRLRGKKASESIGIKLVCLSAVATATGTLFLTSPLSPSKIDMGLSFVPARTPVRTVEQEASSNSRAFYLEGRIATIAVLTNDQDNTISLRSDGKVEGTVPLNFGLPAVGSDLSTESLLSLLPVIFSNKKDPASAFIVGYGTGTTAATLSEARPSIHLTVAEIEPAVVRAGQCFKHNYRLIDPHTVTAGDARQILQKKDNLFDIIISQPSEPWVHGSTNLFSIEFYKLVKNRLASGGKFSQWLQLYGTDNHSLASAIRTFQSVFPHSFIFHPRGAGEIIIIGSNDTINQKVAAAQDEQALQKNFYTVPLRPLLAQAGIESLNSLREDILLDSKDLAQVLIGWQATPGTTLVSDDNMALEMESVPEIENAANTIDGNLALLCQKESDTRPEQRQEQDRGQYRRAVAFLRAGKEKEASQLIDDLTGKDPCDTSALNLAALIELGQGNLPQAAQLIRKSTKLNPSKASTHLLRSFLALVENDAPTALKEADFAHRLSATDYRPYVLAGAALHLAGEDIQALAKLNKARQICTDGVILKEVDGLAEDLFHHSQVLESKKLSGTIASRLTRLIEAFSSSSITRCNDVF